ncbi:MAG: hypothetical protein U9R79_21200 [Armatimonadota bacterium]|nr:hypothetical protein [Armatimonadota bacterium]
MTAEQQERMPWEGDAEDLTDDEIREQLARMLATGALQAAREGGRFAGKTADPGGEEAA